MKILIVIKYLFAVIGLGLLIGAGYMANNTRAFLARAVHAQGTVVDLASRRSSDHSLSYYPEVAFQDANGRTIRFQSASGSNPPSYSRGDKVAVLYLPSTPENARIDGFMGVWFGTVIVGGLGLVFFLIGGGIILAGVRKSRMKADLLQHGRRIESDALSVETNTSVAVNGKNPFRIVAQWRDPASGATHAFRSDNVWTDPTDAIKGKSARIFVDRNDLSRYYVDLSSLPGVVP